MMFGWDREDKEAMRAARDDTGREPKVWIILAVCLTPPIFGLVFMIVRALLIG